MALSRRNFLLFGTSAAATSALEVTVPISASAFEPLRERYSGFILLNSNENPYGASEIVMAAMRDALSQANRYPDFHYTQFVHRVANFHGISPEQIMPGCGSTEVLRVAALAFGGPGKKLLIPSPTFEAIGEYAQGAGTEVVKVPLNSDFAHDLSATLARIDNAATLVYICNPNNPTASLTPRKDIDAFLGKLPAHTYVVIDEAYHHFVDSPDYVSFIEKPLRDPRIIVARTFSKVYGMAGMRLGYAVGARETIVKLYVSKLQDSINVAAAQAGLAALDDTPGLKTAVAKNSEARREFVLQAHTRKLPLVPSHANFAMVKTGRPARTLIEHFKSNGILVGRPFPPFEDYLRVSFGAPSEMSQFWRVWDLLPRA